VAGETEERTTARAALQLRLKRLEEGLASWAAYTADQHLPEGERRGLPEPADSVEALNTLHASALEEIWILDRLERP